jgi:RNA polymerase sigma factor (sigma-70 family)
MSAAGGESDDDLVERFRSGDRSAFLELYGRWSPGLWAIARKRLGNNQDAEDAVQKTVLKAMEKISQYRGPNTFGPWLMTILRNECASLRRPQRIVLTPDPEEGLAGSRTPAADDDQAMLVSTLEMLEPAVARVIFLKDVVGMTGEQVAAKLGISLSEYRRMRHAGLRDLRRLMGNE